MDTQENTEDAATTLADIDAAVALAIEAGEGLDDSGVPDFEGIAEQVEGVTVEEVAAAAEAYYAAKEDAAAGGDGGDGGAGGAEETGGDDDETPKSDEEAKAEAKADAKATSKRRKEGRAEAGPLVIAATEKIIKAGDGAQFERGAPAVWALRNEVGGPVSKAAAAAAYEFVTGNPWPWPPTQQEMAAAGKRRYPAGVYHKTKPSQTVADEAAEAVAKKDGFKRARDFTAKDWVAIWARETGASPEEQAAAMETAKRDPKRKK